MFTETISANDRGPKCTTMDNRDPVRADRSAAELFKVGSTAGREWLGVGSQLQKHMSRSYPPILDLNHHLSLLEPKKAC